MKATGFGRPAEFGRGRWNRRAFLQASGLLTAGTLSGLARGSLSAAEPAASKFSPRPLIDTNVTLSAWPFRRLPLEQPSQLVARLRRHRVTQAWAGTFDGLLHKNLAAVNERLAEDCRRQGAGMLLPFGSINPMLPRWKEELIHCRRHHRMAGIRLHPNYHGYRLDDPLFAELIDLAMDQGLIVQVALTMEDERMQHRLARVPNVDASPLPGLLESRPRCRLMLLNWFREVKGGLLQRLSRFESVVLDLATIEGVGGVGQVLKELPRGRLLFGSHAPFFYFEAAWLKLNETPLTTPELNSICLANAKALLAP